MIGKKQQIIRVLILVGVFFTPFICFYIVDRFANDKSGLGSVVYFAVGFGAIIVSAIIGPIQSHFVRSNKSPYLSLAGYVLPAAFAIACAIYFIFSSKF